MLSTLKMEVTLSSETSFLPIIPRRHIAEEGILNIYKSWKRKVRVSVVMKGLRYKQEGPGFEIR
jgi:hypothetical protein